MAAIASEYLADVLEPEKFAAAIFGVTLAFTVLSANTVGLRAWIRVRKGQFGNDDYLMCTALVVNLYLFLWQIFYAINLVFIKTSILTTLKGIAKGLRYVYAIWGLIVVVSLLSIAGVITLLAKCRPIQSNWTGNGSCIESDVFVALSKTAYAFDVLSDLAMATISTLLLWTPRMRLRSKVLTVAALGLGVVASMASLIRTIYTDAYSSDDNYLFNTGKIVLWTVVECGIGIIAGSLPMLGLLHESRRIEKKWEELELQQSQVDLTKVAPTHPKAGRV
ncbi:putative cation-transporting atpase 4 [Diaporthe ampelina]|uniref:Putative cation-transporting atpase 4 n=1 Tax=Diaporthe ampelina TaxID=1214573 RepID=A0A0G2HU54_9PEZI|nr:putative cation-transporting atpase 4 [Diaporthe ampelina]